VKTVHLRENARCATIETNGNEKIRDIRGQKEGEEHSCAMELARVYWAIPFNIRTPPIEVLFETPSDIIYIIFPNK